MLFLDELSLYRKDAGTYLIGDFSKAVLFDRESLAITFGTINDQFIRNVVTVLGEIRAGFGVIRPSSTGLPDTTPQADYDPGNGLLGHVSHSFRVGEVARVGEGLTREDVAHAGEIGR